MECVNYFEVATESPKIMFVFDLFIRGSVSEGFKTIADMRETNVDDFFSSFSTSSFNVPTDDENDDLLCFLPINIDDTRAKKVSSY